MAAMAVVNSGQTEKTEKRAKRSRGEWQIRAACRGPHATVFFPPQQFERKGDRLEREQRAKKICATCSVAAACLDYAIAIREPHGIWGGLNESERRAMLPPKPVAVKVQKVQKTEKADKTEKAAKHETRVTVGARS